MFNNNLSYDFRRGNYVLENGKHIKQVTSILGDTILTNSPGKQYISPIHLTPEWAEKMGFKYFKSRSGKNTRTWYKDHFFIYFGKKNGPKMNNKFKLPYVHNLQNLWWEMKKMPLNVDINILLLNFTKDFNKWQNTYLDKRSWDEFIQNFILNNPINEFGITSNKLLQFAKLYENYKTDFYDRRNEKTFIKDYIKKLL